MFVLRNKLSIFKTIIEWSILALVAISIYLAISQPLFYILVALFVLVFLLSIHKSNFVVLKKDGIIYRKYLIWKKIKYKNVKILFITKLSYIIRANVVDFHDKETKLISGSIFLMKDLSLSAKISLKNSVSMYGEWSNTFIDTKYTNSIFETILEGGFSGDIYITDEMNNILGSDLVKLLIKMNFDMTKFKVLAIE